jgi:predicted dehydrogenase
MRLAFIGGFGHHYLRGALRDASTQIDRPVAVASSGPEDDRAEELAHRLGDARFYKDARELFDDFRPQIASVGATFGRNGDFAADALERDIPVVSDKPVASTWEQFERIKKATAQTKRVLLTEFDFRSRPEFRAAREVVRAGRLGTPVLATAQKSYRFGNRPKWYADRARYAGTMLWIASHAIDAIWFSTGKRLVAVTGRQGNVTRPDYGTMEDHCTALFELEGGGTGIAHADYFRPDKAKSHGDDRLRVAGSAGVVEVRDGSCMLIDNDGGEQDVTRLVETKPIHEELLAAVQGESQDLYSTAASMEIAAVLLHARDAADQQDWRKVTSAR